MMTSNSKIDLLEGERDTLLISKNNFFDKLSIHTHQCCSHLVTYPDIPEWYNANPYIYHGYRKQNKSLLHLLSSIFEIHNETFNIWTHIVGTIIFCTILTTFLLKSSILSAIPIGIFLVSTILCFINSVVMHTFYPHSKKACCILCSLDYSGIFLLVFGGYTAFIHYEFYCHTNLQVFYYVFLALIGSLTLFLICNKSNSVRSGAFLLLGLSSLVPIIHRRIIGDEDGMLLRHSNKQLIYIGLTLFIIVIGIFFYVSRIPERFHRDMFNIILSSHQIFHICTIIAAYIYYTALIELYNFYSSHSCDLT